ncbi:hypothetical protein JW859_01995 [bacterium]|nr:hypothetical protein [bacterium]
MRFLLLVLAAGTAVWLAGCSSTGGIWETPVFNLKIGEMTVPAGPLVSGDPATFTVSWRDGRSPFQVEWTFEEGTQPSELTATEPGQQHSAAVTLLNNNAEATQFYGVVIITDQDQSEVRANFSFTVEPNPAS